ncbi:MAG: FG-GAP-like repeat-containing protein [Candidatus Neomarinimicrobiota bacterium]|nr:FG-GAP-like repeat-containing protein [Candidatus Neomarinimicrobiota bacterium]
MKAGLSFIIVLATASLTGQVAIRSEIVCPVIVEGETLNNAFTGGFNRPIAQFLDWDDDGLIDLFVTDADAQIQHYEQSGSSHNSFVFHTRSFGGIPIGFWFRFIDYDLDGDYDLIHSGFTPLSEGAFSLFVYENVDDNLQFRTDKLLDDSGRPLVVGAVMIPTFSDLDGDRWPDLMVNTVAGTVTKYKNLGVQNQLPLWQFETNAFQDIMIVSTYGRGNRHGVGSIEFFDIDADGDNDLFWGDMYQSGLLFLENIGTATHPDIRDSLMIMDYPPQAPLETSGYNVARFVDLDKDGDSELFATVQSGVFGTDYVDNFVFFENIGSDSLPFFQHITDRFIAALDLGSSSAPVFADIDADGDADLFIGNEFNDFLPGFRGTVFFFRNKGTKTSPFFVLEDSTYFAELTGNNLVPTFGDLDGDRDMDAIVGDWNGDLYHYENLGTSQSPVFEYKGKYLDLDVGQRAHPSLGDLDGDNDLDLIVGRDDGNILLWRNLGSPEAPEFELKDESFLNTADLGRMAAPAVVDLDLDDRMDLVIGTAGGLLFSAFERNGTWIVKEFDEIPYAGPQLAPAVSDLNNDGRLEIAMGSLHGGLQLFEVDASMNTEMSLSPPRGTGTLKAYPNPYNGELTISVEVESAASIEISVHNLLGQKIETIIDSPFHAGTHQFFWHRENLPSGIYLLMAVTSKRDRPQEKLIQKIVYIK